MVFNEGRELELKSLVQSTIMKFCCGSTEDLCQKLSIL